MIAIGQFMHIDRTNQIPVPGKLAFSAHPISAPGFVFMPTCRTPTRCSSFRAGEAHDVSGFAFVGQVINILAIFPQSHALIVVSAFVPIAHPIRIANKEGSHLLLDTKVDHLTCGFVPQVTNAPLGTTTLLVFGSLKSLPAMGVFLAAPLLFGNLAQLLAALSFERADATPGDDHSLARVGGDGSQVDLAEVYGGLHRAGSLLGLWDLYTDMQFKATVPDQGASTTVFWQVDGQDKRS